MICWGDGRVTHCCNSNYPALGNLNKQSIEEIWTGRSIKRLREHMQAGRLDAAGCEQYCRAVQWERLKANGVTLGDIPHGVAQVSGGPEELRETPACIGLLADWRCNLKCTHCIAPRNGVGLSEHLMEQLQPSIQHADMVQLLGGELTINSKAMGQLEGIGGLAFDTQPAVFMSTNGMIGVDSYMNRIAGLRSFLLRFSLEGLEDGFERIRGAGTWRPFQRNLQRAQHVFAQMRTEGRDWRLYLNYCVMSSNFGGLPDVVRFAVENEIPLILSPLLGMRHINENPFMHAHLRIPDEEVEAVVEEVRSIVEHSNYGYGDELLCFLRYLVGRLDGDKLNMAPSVLRAMTSHMSGQNADRFLYTMHKLRFERPAALYALYRKARKTLGTRRNTGA